MINYEVLHVCDFLTQLANDSNHLPRFAKEPYRMSVIKIDTLPVGKYQTNCYLVENQDTGECFIVDPGAEGGKIIHAVGSRKPVAVLITHGHFDHIGGADAVCAHFRIPLYAFADDVPKLTDAATNGSRDLDRDLVIQTQAMTLVGEQKLRLAGLEIAVMHTPGHSRGSCCFLLPEDQGVFCGDTLFQGGYGRTDISDGDFAQLKQSLRRLIFEIPKQVAYPGHGPQTMAGREKDRSL
jgi:glyoxylase-like metal-dependent hydrolase (beta-lactamase superfamily II)